LFLQGGPFLFLFLFQFIFSFCFGIFDFQFQSFVLCFLQLYGFLILIFFIFFSDTFFVANVIKLN
jgi:hypothetical protein